MSIAWCVCVCVCVCVHVCTNACVSVHSVCMCGWVGVVFQTYVVCYNRHFSEAYSVEYSHRMGQNYHQKSSL